MVKQVRVLRSVALMGVLFGVVLWLVRGDLVRHADAALAGTALGTVYGALRWWRISRRISRRDRRFERNKVLVRFISPMEVVLAAAVASHYLLAALAALLILALALDWLSGHRWAVLVGAAGASASVLLVALVVRYERRHGPVHYQYDSRTWAGAEGMLYETGETLEALSPGGRVRVGGEIWNAVSASGEPIAAGERIEVLSREGMTLRVDRLSAPAAKDDRAR